MSYRTREEEIIFYSERFSRILNSVLDKLELRGQLDSDVYYEFLIKRAGKEFPAFNRIELNGHDILHNNDFIVYAPTTPIGYRVTSSGNRTGLDDKVRAYIEQNVTRIVRHVEGDKAAEQLGIVSEAA